MIKELIHDPIFLAIKSASASIDDLQVAEDLLDTLAAHKDTCVGMAANMIGVSKRIIAFDNDGEHMVMFNPQIIKKLEPFDAEESCLLCLVVLAYARDIKQLKLSGKMKSFKQELKPLPVGQHR